MKTQVSFRKSLMSLASALLIALFAASAVSSFVFPATAACEDQVSVPMTFEHWNKLHTGNWEETAEGLRIYGTAYRKETVILSETIYNFRDSESFVKWKAHSISYASFLITLHNDILWAGHLTTHHSWDGSTVISSDLWYYSRIRVNPDKTYQVVTSAGDYDTNGGNVILTNTGTLDEQSWKVAGKTFFGAGLTDNYNATSAYMVIGEVRTNALPVEIGPTDSTLYDFESVSEIPAGFDFDEGWGIADSGYDSSKALYLSTNKNASVTLDAKDAVLISFRVRWISDGNIYDAFQFMIDDKYYLYDASPTGQWSDKLTFVVPEGAETFKWSFYDSTQFDGRVTSGITAWIDDIEVKREPATAACENQVTTVGDNYDPAWSPDGKRLAFRSIQNGSWNIWTMNTDGSGGLQISNMPSQRAAWGPTYQPNNDRIYYMDNSLSGADFWWVIRTSLDGSAGRNQVMLVPGGEPFTPPSFSEDGTRFCYVHASYNENRVREARREIKIANADGSNVRTVLRDDALRHYRGIVWGKGTSKNKMAYSSKAVSGIQCIFTVDTDGSNVTQITDPSLGDCEVTDFVSDKIFFTNNNQVSYVNVQTKKITRITDDAYENSQAVLSPDGKKIAYTSKRDGVCHIYITCDAEEAALSLPDITACPGSSVSIPLTLNNLNNEAVEGIDVKIAFDPGVLNVGDVTLTGSVLDGKGYDASYNMNNGEIAIGIYANGSTFFRGSGIIAYVNFNVVGMQGTSTDLTFTESILNESAVDSDKGAFKAECCEMSGKAVYYSDPAIPVSDVTVTAGTYSVSTDADGNYKLSVSCGEDYTLTASKTNQLGGLSATDVSKIARYAAGFSDAQLTCLQKIAADVNQDGLITAVDASRAARYAVGKIASLNNADIHWAFTPNPIDACGEWPPISYISSREYQDSDGIKSGQDFIAVRLGDVTGNWTPDTGRSRQARSKVRVSEYRLDALQGSQLTLPVVLNQEEEIEGIDAEISFDKKLLRVKGVTLTGGILNSRDYSLQFNGGTPGELNIGISAIKDIVSGNGELMVVNFEVIGKGSSVISLTDFDCNEKDADAGFSVNSGVYEKLKVAAGE